MARYDYECQKCQECHEVDKPMTDAGQPEACPNCQNPMDRLYTGTFAYSIQGDNSGSTAPKRSLKP